MYKIIIFSVVISFSVFRPLYAKSEIEDSELIKQAVQLREKKPELLNGAKGVLILEVIKNSQAEKKGFQRGDIIVSYAGQQMNSVEQLIKAVCWNPCCFSYSVAC